MALHVSERVFASHQTSLARLIPASAWTGIIKGITSVAGQGTYTVELDLELRTAEETEVDALAEEMEPHETNE
jgi:hypothetical protein